MDLARTSVLNGAAVLIRLGTMLALNKVLAVFVGPAGYALIGQFQNLVAMSTTLASGAVNTGVTKYTAQYHDDPARQRKVWHSASWMALIGVSTLTLTLLALRRPLARWALADEALASVIVWLAGALMLLVLNALMLAILNGRKAIGAFVAANIAGTLISAGVAVALVMNFGLYGALVALAVGQALACCFTAIAFRHAVGLPVRSLFGRPDRTATRALGGFALMSLTSAIVVPLSQMLVRDGLIERMGLHSAGLWQALWKISETHLLLLTSTLTVYFLPRFSEIREPSELRREVWRGYRFVLPIVVASSLVIFALREPLVRTLLTREFLDIAPILGWQLIGDALKIASWVLGYTLVSDARVRAFVATEVTFSALFVALTLAGATLDGLRGTAIAYALTYLLHGAAMMWLFKRRLGRSYLQVSRVPL
jgi:PST family polysaccharide transporter